VCIKLPFLQRGSRIDLDESTASGSVDLLTCPGEACKEAGRANRRVGDAVGSDAEWNDFEAILNKLVRASIRELPSELALIEPSSPPNYTLSVLVEKVNEPHRPPQGAVDCDLAGSLCGSRDVVVVGGTHDRGDLASVRLPIQDGHRGVHRLGGKIDAHRDHTGTLAASTQRDVTWPISTIRPVRPCNATSHGKRVALLFGDRAWRAADGGSACQA
jgi:hypothetical protein